MNIGRYIFIIVLVVGALAALRLGWVTYHYTRTIEALRALEIEIVEVNRTAENDLELLIQVRNHSEIPITVQYLSLNLVDDSGRFGATYDRIPEFQVEPQSSSEIAANVGITSTNPLPEDLPSSLRFRGEWRLELPSSDRPFQQPIAVVWNQEP